MNTVELAKKNFERKTWTEEMLQALVNKGKLTQEQMDKIVAEGTK